MGLVERRIGGDACALLHVMLHDVDGRDVCRIVVERAPSAIYVVDDTGAHYWLRTGNVTRELDVREAIQHQAARATQSA